MRVSLALGFASLMFAAPVVAQEAVFDVVNATCALLDARAPRTDGTDSLSGNLRKAQALLRERYGYQGELRAIGDVQRDQLAYLARVGFTAFAIRDDRPAQAALDGLRDFSDQYQATVLQPEPLFKRRTPR